MNTAVLNKALLDILKEYSGEQFRSFITSYLPVLCTIERAERVCISFNLLLISDMNLTRNKTYSR